MKTENIQRWLASSQCNVPYELDFFTPFKEMAHNGEHQITHSHAAKRKPPSSVMSAPPRRKHTPIVISSNGDSSSSSSSYKYKRRQRHKTRKDRYEYKGDRNRTGGKATEKGVKEASRFQSKQKRHMHGAKKEVAENFHAKNVSSNRLTLNQHGGFFKNGKASVPVCRTGVPDLSFSEQAFLKLSHATGNQPTADACDRSKIRSRENDRREKRSRDKEAKISEYFRPPVYDQAKSRPMQGETRTPNSSLRQLVYETPCRQRQPSAEPSARVLADVDLPSPPYLGFGGSGPEPMPNSALRPATRIIHTTGGHSRDSTPDQVAAGNADELSTLDDSRLQKTKILFTNDPRAMHSPTSNFKFARLQQAQSQKTHIQDETHCHGLSTNAKERDDEILVLLRELKQQQQIEKQQPQPVPQQLPEGRAQDHAAITPSNHPAEDSSGLVEMLIGKLRQMDQIRDRREVLQFVNEALQSLAQPRQQSLNSTPQEADIAQHSAGEAQVHESSQTRPALTAQTAGRSIEPDSKSEQVDPEHELDMTEICEISDTANAQCAYASTAAVSTSHRQEQQRSPVTISVAAHFQSDSTLEPTHGNARRDNSGESEGVASAMESLPCIGFSRPRPLPFQRAATPRPVFRLPPTLPSIYEAQALSQDFHDSAAAKTFTPPPSSVSPFLKTATPSVLSSRLVRTRRSSLDTPTSHFSSGLGSPWSRRTLLSFGSSAMELKPHRVSRDQPVHWPPTENWHQGLSDVDISEARIADTEPGYVDSDNAQTYFSSGLCDADADAEVSEQNLDFGWTSRNSAEDDGDMSLDSVLGGQTRGNFDLPGTRLSMQHFWRPNMLY